MGLGTDNPTPRSYWQASLDDELTSAVASVRALPRSSPIVIIGAGLLGISTAYWLARSGVDVLVLDRDGITAGATGRNAGFVVSGAAESYPVAIQRYGAHVTHAVYRFTLENRQLLRDVIATEAIHCDYREQGYLSLATSPQSWEHCVETHGMLQAGGFPSELLDRDDLQSRIGVTLRAQVVGARYAPQEAQIHPARLLHGLARAAVKGGARFAFPYNVTRVEPRGGGWDIVVAAGERTRVIKAQHVLCATNAWLPAIVPQLVGAITPVRGQVLCTAPMPPIFPCAMSADDGYQYWQQLPDGRIVLGGGRKAVADQDVGYDTPELHPGVQSALDGYLPTLFEGMEDMSVERRWAGIMGFSRDALPYIGAVPNQPGLFVAGGFTGHGMPFGLRSGQALAESLISGVVPEALTPFRLDRP